MYTDIFYSNQDTIGSFLNLFCFASFLSCQKIPVTVTQLLSFIPMHNVSMINNMIIRNRLRVFICIIFYLQYISHQVCLVNLLRFKVTLKVLCMVMLPTLIHIGLSAHFALEFQVLLFKFSLTLELCKIHSFKFRYSKHNAFEEVQL